VAQRVDVARAQLPVGEPGGDRLVGAALGLERLRELLARKRVERPLLDLLLRGGDGRARGSAAAERVTGDLMRQFDVRAPSPDTLARSLSGGNQQKLIVAREMFRQPDLILAVQPTRGLDVGAIEFVHRQLVQERDKGKGVLVVSFELDEVLDLSDRILVLYQGQIVGEFASGSVERATLGLLMGGRRIDEHQPAGLAE